MSDTMERIIKCMLFTPGPKGWGLPVCMWGSPGAAKSDIIEKVTREWGMHLEVLSPGERGEGAFGVVPVPHLKKDGTMVLTYPAPDFFDIFTEFGRGVLFIDEFNTAPNAVRPALLGAVHARRIGSSFLGQGVRVIAAGNPPGHGGTGADLPKPNANRMGHLEWEAPDATQWTQWLIGMDAKTMSINIDKPKDPEKEETRVLKLWDEEHAKVKGLLAGFIRRRPEQLHVEPEDESPQASRAWQSRRSWDLASRAMAGAAIHGLNEVEEMELISSFVGPGGAKELFVYRKEADLPDPVDVLEGKVKFKVDEERLDRTMAVLSACAAIVCSPQCQNKDDRIESMWKLLGGVAGDDMKDIALVSADPLIQKDIGTNTKTAIKVLAGLHPLIAAARRAA